MMKSIWNRYIGIWVFLIFALPLLLPVLTLFVLGKSTAALSATEWFDPVFLQYNLLLVLAAVLVVPAVTVIYVRNRKEERLRRLKVELSDKEWERYGKTVECQNSKIFRLQDYMGSLTALVVVLALGTAILLLMKPVCVLDPAAPLEGVDLCNGANILLAGPYISLYPEHKALFFQHITVSLTAFQFGFLGAYVYFLGSLVRGFFTLDLTPHTFVNSTIRIVTGSLLSLVVAFLLVPLDAEGGGAGIAPVLQRDTALAALPLVSFFIGHFPAQGLDFISQMGGKILNVVKPSYRMTPLSRLPGMSHAHEMRLQREGFDNVENLATASPVELLLRTGFSYRQVRGWVGQAWLCSHLGDDYGVFLKATGICSADELATVLEIAEADPWGRLETAAGTAMTDKARLIACLLPDWHKQC